MARMQRDHDTSQAREESMLNATDSEALNLRDLLKGVMKAYPTTETERTKTQYTGNPVAQLLRSGFPGVSPGVRLPSPRHIWQKVARDKGLGRRSPGWQYLIEVSRGQLSASTTSSTSSRPTWRVSTSRSTRDGPSMRDISGQQRDMRSAGLRNVFVSSFHRCLQDSQRCRSAPRTNASQDL